MANTLADYLAATRRLLHDASGQFWSDAELQAYINEARVRVVRDTGCYRKLQTLTLTPGKEVYTFASDLPSGVDTIDVLGISVIWGQTRIACAYLAWSEFQARVRSWTLQVGQPSVFSIYGQNSVYVGYVPDISYPAEFDTVISPPILVANNGDTPAIGTIGLGTITTATEVIPIPFTSPVPFFAAYLAKLKEQSYTDAQDFEGMYEKECMRAIGSSFTRRIRNPYGGGT